MEQSKKRKALNYIVGALILIFVGIGLVSTVRFLSSHVQHLSLREQQREQSVKDAARVFKPCFFHTVLLSYIRPGLNTIYRSAVL